MISSAVKAGITPKLTVLVVTARALKMHGGVSQDKIKEPNLVSFEAGGGQYG